MCKRHKKKENPNLIHLLTNIYIKQVSIYLKSNASSADYHRFLMLLSLRCGLFDSWKNHNIKQIIEYSTISRLKASINWLSQPIRTDIPSKKYNWI